MTWKGWHSVLSLTCKLNQTLTLALTDWRQASTHKATSEENWAEEWRTPLHLAGRSTCVKFFLRKLLHEVFPHGYFWKMYGRGWCEFRLLVCEVKTNHCYWLVFHRTATFTWLLSCSKEIQPACSTCTVGHLVISSKSSTHQSRYSPS